MVNNITYRFVCGTVLMCLFAGGCRELKSSFRDKKDLVAAGQIKIQTAPSKNVIISNPCVLQDGSELFISGSIQRKPNINDSIPGCLTIAVISSENKELDRLRVAWVPKDIPTIGTRQSSYQLRWAIVPPPDSTIRLFISTDEKLLVQPARSTGGSQGIGLSYTHPPYQPHTPMQPLAHPNQPIGGGRGY